MDNWLTMNLEINSQNYKFCFVLSITNLSAEEGCRLAGFVYNYSTVTDLARFLG